MIQTRKHVRAGHRLGRIPPDPEEPIRTQAPAKPPITMLMERQKVQASGGGLNL